MSLFSTFRVTTGRELRPYQADAIQQTFNALAAGCWRPVLPLPTGAGKTRVAIEIARRAIAKGRRVAFVAPLLSLIEQTAGAFENEGFDPLDLSIVQADHPRHNSAAPIQICSLQTLEARGMRPRADVVLVDECHIRSAHLLEWMDDPEAERVAFIGLSATPWARGMGLQWCNLLDLVTMSHLIRDGYLVPFRIFAPSKPDMTGAKLRKNLDGERDFSDKDAAKAMADTALAGNIIETWCSRAENRPTLAFCADRAHAADMAAKFRRAGVPAEYVDAYTEIAEREAMAERLRAGKTKIICSVSTMTAGVDLPFVSCIILARPTRSEIRYVQCFGRGLRTSPETGKKDLIVFDHADVASVLGFPDTIEAYALDGSEADKAAKRNHKAERPTPLPKACPSCHFMRPPGIHVCPECGFAPEVRMAVSSRPAEMNEVDHEGRKKKGGEKFPHLSASQLYGELLGYARSKGIKPGFAFWKFVELRGNEPSAMTKRAPATTPSPEVAAWLKHKFIAEIKAREKARREEAGA